MRPITQGTEEVGRKGRSLAQIEEIWRPQGAESALPWLERCPSGSWRGTSVNGESGPAALKNFRAEQQEPIMPLPDKENSFFDQGNILHSSPASVGVNPDSGEKSSKPFWQSQSFLHTVLNERQGVGERVVPAQIASSDKNSSSSSSSSTTQDPRQFNLVDSVSFPPLGAKVTTSCSPTPIQEASLPELYAKLASLRAENVKLRSDLETEEKYAHECPRVLGGLPCSDEECAYIHGKKSFVIRRGKEIVLQGVAINKEKGKHYHCPFCGGLPPYDPAYCADCDTLFSSDTALSQHLQESSKHKRVYSPTDI